jgi:hypothetical protein
MWATVSSGSDLLRRTLSLELARTRLADDVQSDWFRRVRQPSLSSLTGDVARAPIRYTLGVLSVKGAA